jgi:hypothetical protein
MKNTAENRLQQREIYFSVLRNAEIKEYPEINAVIGIGNDTKGRPSAIGFTGTKGKPDFYYYFKDETRRETYINKFIEEQKQKLEYKAERQAKKQAPTVYALPFKIGDIIYNSWGYDQTNIDFYQVVRCTKSSVFIRPIKAEYSDRSAGCDMAAYVTPLKNEFTGEEIRKKIQWYEGNAYIKFEFGGCSRWQEGQEIYCSWYA